jgi:hypothetical protein
MKSVKRVQRDLAQPFSQNDLEWRVQASGSSGNGNIWCRVLAYVTNRAIQQRFDDAVGAFGWKNEFAPLPNGSVGGSLCGISIYHDGEWITKYDGADNTAIEATKGGLSGSMKRAAVQWGVGRYLYDVEAHYAEVINEATFKKLQRNEKDLYEFGQLKDKTKFYWKPPTLDAKFLPKKHVKPSIVKSIKDLADETTTDLKKICDAYGVDDVVDLFEDEAGQVVSGLAKRKTIQEQKNESDKKD